MLVECARSWLVLGAWVLVACARTGGPGARPREVRTLTPAEIAARATPSVVAVRTGTLQGTGFVVNRQGWIATNLHVVAGSVSVTVVLADRREIPVVEVLAADPNHDLVVLRVAAAEDLPALLLGDSAAVRAGDPVVVIGHPLGLADTVSNGLVSAVRIVDPQLTLLQISAPIAAGSSGGPLFNERGEVIGVATAFVTQGQNLNFGIPVRYLKRMLETTAPLSLEELAKRLNLPASSNLPRVERSVPQHEASLLRGCTEPDRHLLEKTIAEAIEVGAPLYNHGNFAACYHIYEGAASDLEHRLPPTCPGPRQALAHGRSTAAARTDPSAQAWALRDAFDGLLLLLREGRP